jgi:hypothetical protein
MIQRCMNPTCREYPLYGARGIKVCDRWLEALGFVNFLNDLGRQPKRRASIHRIDNDGHYESGNVVWTNQKTQCRNRRNNHLLTHEGRTQTLAEWAEDMGIKPVTLCQRLRKGWSVEEALTVPVKRRKPYEQWSRRPDARKPGRKPRRDITKGASAQP